MPALRVPKEGAPPNHRWEHMEASQGICKGRRGVTERRGSGSPPPSTLAPTTAVLLGSGGGGGGLAAWS